MRLLRTLAPVACLFAVTVLGVAGEAVKHAPQPERRAASNREYVWASPENVRYAYTPNRARAGGGRRAASASAVLSTFQVTYDTNFNANPAAKAAFQAAIDILSEIIVSPPQIPIAVDARFINLGPGQLGSAFSATVCASSAGIPNTYYAAALANTLNGNTACSKSGKQITAELNSNLSSWDFGSAPVDNKVNFTTVALHELIHGLGFYGSMDSVNGIGSFGYVPPDESYVDPFDRFAVSGSDVALLSMANPSAALHAQLVSNNTFFNGPNAMAGNGGVKPKIESRNFGAGSDHGFLFGSSYFHIDDALYTGTPNGLMTYALGSAEVYTDPGPIVRGILKDIGWALGCGFALSPASATAAASGGTNTVTLASQPGCAWTASSGNTAIATITSATSGTGSATVSYNVAPNSSVSQRVVTLTIGGQPFVITQSGTGPAMSVDKTSLIFSAVTSGGAFTSRTPAQAVRLTQSGSGTVTWTATSNKSWLLVANGSGAASSTVTGSGSATLNLSTQFAPGLATTEAATVTIDFTGAGNTAGPIHVTLNSVGASSTSAPVGSFDTPTDNSTGVTGSIAVTGWAVDDIGITGVRVMRAPIGAEPPTAVIGAVPLVFIGDAVLVDGARPDVATLYPTSPRNTFAGWGYLMLTNFLPNLGNGSFVLYAVADDVEGHSTILGTKTISCSNSNIQAPFGAIDTPAQGGVVSGTLANFGWVLVPGPARADPPGGGTVRVVIDGAIIPAVPTGWTSRSDLSALFSAAAFPGINTALAVAGLDTTTLTNGVHTISWVVTDNLTRASGIGSRYFTVSNGALVLDPESSLDTSTGVIGNAAQLTMPRAAALRLTAGHSLADEVGFARTSVAAIRGRRGFDANAPLQAFAVRNGIVTVQSEELDRIELQIGASGRSYAGYLRTSTGLAPLPIGSALDASTGLFTWQPGVGFVGTYDLVFVEWLNGRAALKQEVRIVLNPKGSGRVGPQTVIDVSDGSIVAGWAADLRSDADTGVDTVHVWAYPAGGGDPIFIGAAAYGGKRPDVAAVYGEQFEKSGYGIRVQGLEPGTYDLAVFAYSTVTGGFVPAKTVRVTVR